MGRELPFNNMDYRVRLEEIFGVEKGPLSLRTIFDCDSTEWTKTTLEKKAFFLEKMLESGYPIERWIEDYKSQYEKTHPHILECIEKSVSVINKKIIEQLIKIFLDDYLINVDEHLNKYSDFKNLEIETLNLINYKYDKNDRELDFVDNLRNFINETNIHDDNYIIKFWIINKWGGISSFKDNFQKELGLSNRDKIDAFLKRILERKPLTKPLFEVISSLSKIASFYNHEEYFVYDSRVIYALNWILLKKQKARQKFFPMPQGRNAKLSLFDLDTLIKLKYKSQFLSVDTSSLYYNHSEAYYIYCDLIKNLAKEIMPNKKTYHMEMLLFSLTDEIFDDLRKNVSIEISN